MGIGGFLRRLPRFVHTARQRHILITVTLVVLMLIFITSTFPPRTSLWTTTLSQSVTAPPPKTLPELQLLNLAQSPNTTTAASRFCEDRFGPSYLYNLQDNAIQYCSQEPESHSRLTCFHTKRRNPIQTDSFCIAQGASLDTSRSQYTLGDCTLRRPVREELQRGLIPYTAIRGYWYDTGPRNVFSQFFTTFETASRPLLALRAFLPFTNTQTVFTILVKREGEGNLWHCLMEIWSLTESLDVLRLTTDPQTAQPFFHAPTDVPNAQVVILDEHPDGPYFDLWTMLAGRPPVRLKEALKSGRFKQGTMLAASPGTKHKVIVPLAGAANPIWENDWVDRACEDAALLKLFGRRVLNHVGVRAFDAPTEEASSTLSLVQVQARQPRKIRVTYIVRKESRRVLYFDALLSSARLAFPDVEARLVDFASLPFAEQVRIVHQETDVLVGVHGAGLTHTMFLHGDWVERGGGKAVVEIQPDIMDYKGFHNMARMLGHGYFMAKAHSMSRDDLEEERVSLSAKERRGGARQEENDETFGGPEDLDFSAQREAHTHEDGHLHKRLDWHFVDVKINETWFLEVIGEAVAYVKGWRESEGLN